MAAAFDARPTRARDWEHRMTDVLDGLAINGQIASATTFTGKKRIRHSFGRIPEAVQMPNLIEVQRASYEQFLQREVRPGVRKDQGIEAVFKSVFPIKDFNERAVLEYVSYEFEDAEVRRRGMHPARHDLCRAAEGQAAPDRVRGGRGNRRALGQGHQGAGRLHGRHPAHDGQGHLRRQRHRARDRLADAPFAGRLLRPRQGQDALARASCCSPRA